MQCVHGTILRSRQPPFSLGVSTSALGVENEDLAVLIFVPRVVVYIPPSLGTNPTRRNHPGVYNFVVLYICYKVSPLRYSKGTSPPRIFFPVPSLYDKLWDGHGSERAHRPRPKAGCSVAPPPAPVEADSHDKHLPRLRSNVITRVIKYHHPPSDEFQS